MNRKEEKEKKNNRGEGRLTAQGASPNKGRLCPNPIRLGSKSLIGGTRLQEDASVLVKPCVDHHWRANTWMPGGRED